MTDEVPEILRLYLKGDIDFNALEDRLIPFAFNPQSEEEQDMVDLVLYHPSLMVSYIMRRDSEYAYQSNSI